MFVKSSELNWKEYADYLYIAPFGKFFYMICKNNEAFEVKFCTDNSEEILSKSCGYLKESKEICKKHFENLILLANEILTISENIHFVTCNAVKSKTNIGFYECSNCGFIFREKIGYFNFCSNCGAKFNNDNVEN